MLLELTVTLLAVVQLEAGRVPHQGFHIKDGYFLEENPLGVIQRPGLTLIQCVAMCKCNCKIVDYNRVQNTCRTYQVAIPSDQLSRFPSNLSLKSHSDWAVVSKDVPEMLDGNWTMVFRAQSGINSSVIEYWNNAGRHDEEPFYPDCCLQYDHSTNCRRHYRNRLLDSWPSLSIEKVRFSLFKNGREVGHIVFNGTDTTSVSWFHQRRILSTSWSDLMNSSYLQYFDLNGFSDSASRRIFHVSGNHSGCNSDSTYTQTIDVYGDGCSSLWSITGKPIPLFLYSRSKSLTVISKKAKEIINQRQLESLIFDYSKNLAPISFICSVAVAHMLTN